MFSWKFIFMLLGLKGFFFILISDDLLLIDDYIKWMIYDGKKKINEFILIFNIKYFLYWMYFEIFFLKL